jgi:hypothetical protein
LKGFIVIIVFILSASTLLYSQNSKLVFEFEAFPLYYKIKSHHGFNHKYLSDIDFGAGLGVSYFFSPKSSIKTGLTYMPVNYNVEYKYIFMDSLDPSIPRSADIRLGYLDIPFAYNLNLKLNDKFTLNTTSGITSSFLIIEKDNTLFEDNTVRKSGFTNQLIFSVQLGIGLCYNLNQKLGLKLEPRYRRFFKGFDILMYQQPSSLNIAIGITYNLKKKE